MAARLRRRRVRRHRRRSSSGGDHRSLRLGLRGLSDVAMTDVRAELRVCGAILKEASAAMRSRLPDLAPLLDSASGRALKAAGEALPPAVPPPPPLSYHSADAIAEKVTVGQLNRVLAKAYGALLVAKLVFGFSPALRAPAAVADALAAINDAVEQIENYPQICDMVRERAAAERKSR